MKCKTLLYSTYTICFLFVFVWIGCGQSQPGDDRLNFEKKGRQVPGFNADSAYAYIQQQVDFGPRNPGSKGHQLAREYLIKKLTEFAGEGNVFAQNFTHIGYNQDTLHLSNIIAAFNPTAQDRIMLCAHWDTRPRADEDSVGTDQPILGADDGGSGVAVLLELARIFGEDQPPIGVDIILFDAEDYGKTGEALESYFLGSRYWANNPPVENYRPRFGILLDMVGGNGAQFPKEKNSLQVASTLVNGIWEIAAEQGFSDTFVQEEGSYISDDHVQINRILRIPTIDIVRHSIANSKTTFAPYWHTHQDNTQVISRQTLDTVGEVLTELIYNRI